MCTCTHSATLEIYTLSLHALFRSPMMIQRIAFDFFGGRRIEPDCDALTTDCEAGRAGDFVLGRGLPPGFSILPVVSGSMTKIDRKSTRLNSSHTVISYGVFCLKKK